MTQQHHNLSPTYDVEEMHPQEVADEEAALTMLGRTTFYGSTTCAGQTQMQAVAYPSAEAKRQFAEIIKGVQDE